ncbi:hypothetical protein IP91_03877 [Pseudoduganella lurida]|uniref:Toxin-antitoxin system HicB family antitoxin n=1 Tax=Pseudoduganella lurida TaxID=1036180 RepID=A0A562R1W6_9BURK|nr:hypothetical protein [Pseudoduganella lurida]TWI63037.1 hypothetical protein IP91_03877 [Pseudoduganella lurida]
MTTIELRLPRELAEEAAELGLLNPQVVADLLRDEIRRRTFADLLAHGGLAVVDDPESAPPRRRKSQ